MTKLTLSQLSGLILRACDDLQGIPHADIRLDLSLERVVNGGTA